MSYHTQDIPYKNGISYIDYKATVYSPSIIPKPPRLDNSEYEWREHEYIGVKNGTCLIIREDKHDGFVFRYTDTKNPYGWTRCTYVFREGEEKMYPGVCGWADGGLDDNDASWRDY